MDIDHLKSRVLEFLRSENITSAQFAQEIGVQPSGISHIISGRNKPSLDFVVKMLARYPALSTDWLLLGKGPMFRNGSPAELFPGTFSGKTPSEDIFSEQVKETVLKTAPGRVSDSAQPKANADGNALLRPVSSRIVIFHEDGTFDEYFPGVSD
jgi:transcriptional regulator with XRE-family HTH domain